MHTAHHCAPHCATALPVAGLAAHRCAIRPLATATVGAWPSRFPPGLHASRTAVEIDIRCRLPFPSPFGLIVPPTPLHSFRLCSPLALPLPSKPNRCHRHPAICTSDTHNRYTQRQRHDEPQPHTPQPQRQATMADGGSSSSSSSSDIVGLPLERYCNSCGHSSRWSRCFVRLLPDVIARAARRRWRWVATRTRAAAPHNHPPDDRMHGWTRGGECVCVLTRLS